MIGQFTHPVLEDRQIAIWDEIISLGNNIGLEEDAASIIKAYKRLNNPFVIIDHYHANSRYQLNLYENGVRWLQFDGCRQKCFWADWILNFSLFAKDCDYSSTECPRGAETKLLLGPHYAFIRKEFIDAKRQTGIQQRVRKLLYAFGGGDDRGATLFALDATKSIGEDLVRVVLISSLNPNLPDILEWARRTDLNISIRVDEPQIARTMADTDIALIAGGGTPFETAALGIPSIIINIAANQKRNASAFQDAGTAIDLGSLAELKPSALANQVAELISDTNKRHAMATKGRNLIDGKGAKRVANLLLAAKN